jgi:glycosyltransferase involved in cell wall biosynthesis
MLSAIIITRNEARNIAACLESVAFCDERIVVDCGSDDDTVQVSAAAGATVTTRGQASAPRRISRWHKRGATGCCRSTQTSA